MNIFVTLVFKKYSNFINKCSIVYGFSKFWEMTITPIVCSRYLKNGFRWMADLESKKREITKMKTSKYAFYFNIYIFHGETLRSIILCNGLIACFLLDLNIFRFNSFKLVFFRLPRKQKKCKFKNENVLKTINVLSFSGPLLNLCIKC